MQPVYWYCLAYIVGTLVGYYIGRNTGYMKAVNDTLCTLVDEHYVRTRILKDGSTDLIRLPTKYRTKR